MENTQTGINNYALEFNGKGSDYFGIIIINWLLTIVTLGIYYPWAKARQLQFLYGNTSFNGDKFTFHGTGKEMFKGFVKTIIIFGVIIGFYLFMLHVIESPILAILMLYAGFLLITPIAIHGSYRYRMSRTSWRGIRLGYVGNRKELFKNFFIWIFFTIISFGIYSSWLAMNLRTYTLSNVRLGNTKFKYKGEGGGYFGLNLMCYFLTIITLGIYFFWWRKELFAYYVDNLTLEQDDNKLKLKSTVTGGGFFKLMIVNFFLVVFTLGFGYAWAVTRTMKYLFSNIKIKGDVDLNAIEQSQENYTNATGEDMSDFLNLDFII
jgi:uncharacterized membrane protein YjgN (DUF898 family)